MRTNEGVIDRVFRISFGLSILSIALWGPQTPWGYLGAIPLITGLVGYCPIYSLLGVNTCTLRK
jgi:hypothetical protein